MFHLRLLLGLLLFLTFAQPALANETKQVVIVNPIRGEDFWQHSQTILDTPQKQYQEISQNHLPATWLIRFDALTNPEVVSFLKSLDQKQELGLFLEITPSFSKAANVSYNQNPNWHAASSVFLIGYTPDQRKILIDTAFAKFKETFGYSPKSIGAWWIDSYSLSYMRDKYGIEANLNVADQYSTDQYQVWGQYWSLPYYPSRLNALMPAKTKENKIGTVTIQWATRDPYNGYGKGDFDSTYSVQANDYMLHKLDTSYFNKLLDIYPQVTIGLENDFVWQDYGREYQKQIEVLAKRQSQGFLQTFSMHDFAAFYKTKYPDLSPTVVVSADDPLGSSGKVVWYQSPNYRFGWFYGFYGSAIRDLRIFNDSKEESCRQKPCQNLLLSFTAEQSLDDASFSTRWLLDEGKISDLQVIQDQDKVEISYLNQTSKKRLIKLMQNDIEIDEKIQPISFAILNAVQNSQHTNAEKIGVDFTNQANLTNINQVLVGFAKFLIFSFLFFLFPGWVVSKRLLLAIPLGLAIFTFFSYLLGFFHLEWLIWSLPIVSFLALFRAGLPKVNIPKFTCLSGVLIGTVFLGSFSWLLTVFRSGLNYAYGFAYWGPNGHDGIWHLALISELQRNFPPENPIFAGEKLSNYHYFFDLLLAKTGLIFTIDSQDLLFRFFPILIALLSGLLMFKIAKDLFLDDRVGILATFLLYFGGSFGWIINLIRVGDFGGETMFWVQQAASTLLNPPFAISLVFFLAGFVIFQQYQKNNGLNIKLLLLIALLWGVIVEFKAYAGFLVLASLGLLSLEKIILKKEYKTIWLFLACLTVSLLVFLPNNLGSGSLFVFSPLWFIKTMIYFPDRLNWTRLYLAMDSGNILKVVAAYLIGILIFIFGNLGSRSLVFIESRNFIKEKFLFYFAFLGLILPMVVIQKGTNWNSIQFFYYSLLVFNLYAAAGLGLILKRLSKTASFFFLLLFIIFTIPTSYGTISQYLPQKPPARLSQQEIEALNFLKNQPAGTVLTLTYDQGLRERFLEPRPLLAYTSTAYVAAFSNHPTYLEDTINLDILGIDYRGRLNELRDFSKAGNDSQNFLIKYNIAYVYLPKIYQMQVDEGKMGLKTIFENSEVKIYQIMRGI